MRKKKIQNSIKKYFKEISEISGYLWERGWAERNAGNLSVNLTGIVDIDVTKLEKLPDNPFSKTYSNLKNNLILISTAGSRMRYMSKEPHKYILGLYISGTGKHYKYFGLNNDGKISENNNDKKPTSEILTHIAYHNLLKKSGSKFKAILHSHPTEIIAITHIKEYTNAKKLNEVFLKMHPEVKLFIPEGAGLVPFMESSSEEIATATLKLANKHRIVIWEKHGCFAVEETLTEAFELIDILTKSAKIFFLVNRAVSPLSLRRGAGERRK